MDADLFADDIASKPEHLRELADYLSHDNPWAYAIEELSLRDVRRVVLVGMGSSRYAASVIAGQLRAHGINASAELASNSVLPSVDDTTLVVLISASGNSVETLDAAERLGPDGGSVALTNDTESALAERCDAAVALRAGVERGGVACRTYQHTLAMLLSLVDQLRGADSELVARVAACADASQHLVDTSTEWLPDLRRLLIGPAGTHIAAPANRLSSARQSALMLREGPRHAAIGCETGDWSHVDVYLTKTTDYRLLLYAGSRWESELFDWTDSRGSTVVAVGRDRPRATYSLRYPGDSDQTVALLTEVTVAELLAADLWKERADS